jgi:transposase
MIKEGGPEKTSEALSTLARIVIDPFHVIADANKKMDEARRIEQDVYRKKKVQIPRKIFL